DPGPDRAAHARAAETAIAGWILGKILLVIVLRKIEFRGGKNLGRDSAVASGGNRALVHRLRGFGGRALGRRVHVDTGPILGTHIIALPHSLCRIMALPKGLEQLLIGNLFRVEYHQHDLVVTGLARTDFLIGGIWREPARIADRGNVNPVAQLPKLALGAPEASQAENRGFRALRIWPFERAAVDEMARRRGDRFVAAVPGRVCAWHRMFFLERVHPDVLVVFAADLCGTYTLWQMV